MKRAVVAVVIGVGLLVIGPPAPTDTLFAQGGEPLSN